MNTIPPTIIPAKRRVRRKRSAATPPAPPPPVLATLVTSVVVSEYPDPTKALWTFDHPIEWDGETFPAGLVVDGFECGEVLGYDPEGAWIMLGLAVIQPPPPAGTEWHIDGPIPGLSSPGREIVFPQTGVIGMEP